MSIDVDAHRLRRIVGLAAGADRGGIGIKLEGIERRRLVGGLGRELGGEPGDDAEIGLDGDEFAAALPLDDRVMDDLAGGEARSGHLDAVFFLAVGALAVFDEGRGTHRLQRGEARALDRAHHAGAVAHVERGVDRDPDQANADHAGETGAGQPFQPATGAIGTGFAEIDRRQRALGLGHLGEKNRWESGSCGRHEGLAELSTRKATAAVKQSAFPPSFGLPPARLIACFRKFTSGRTTPKRFAVPRNEAGWSPMGWFPSRSP